MHDACACPIIADGDNGTVKQIAEGFYFLVRSQEGIFADRRRLPGSADETSDHALRLFFKNIDDHACVLTRSENRHSHHGLY